MVAVPAATPVIVPLETVAMFASDVVQAPPETVDVKVVVDPTHPFCVPDRVPAEVPLLASSMVEVPVTAIGLVVVLGLLKVPIALPKANENKRVLPEEPV